MTKVLVLYYSSYGHVEGMAEAIAEGAREVPGVEATIKRVPECWRLAVLTDRAERPSLPGGHGFAPTNEWISATLPSCATAE